MNDIKINEFEGPLDLLLHLIKESKMDIFEINIVDITDQYLAYINRMEEMNLDIASEYLVMASELLEIKSRKLLPRQKEKEEEFEEENPEEALINRLVEYQKYKDMTAGLKELEAIRSQIYTKSPTSLKEYADENTVLESNVTLDDLLKAFQKFIERKESEKPLHTKVTGKEITIKERKRDISRILKEKKRVNFLELFDVYTKEYVVVTFLTILEMAKEHALTITQEDNFSEIYCEAQYE